MWSGIIDSVSPFSYLFNHSQNQAPGSVKSPHTHQRGEHRGINPRHTKKGYLTICDSRVVDPVGKGVLPTSQPNEVVAVSVSFFCDWFMLLARRWTDFAKKIASMHHVSFENRRWWFVAEPSAKNYHLLTYVAIYIGGVHNFGGVNCCIGGYVRLISLCVTVWVTDSQQSPQ